MKLIDFVKNKMRMSHLYQPVMIKSLLKNKGVLSVNEIAKQILSYDISEYYEDITNNMVGKVLKNHDIVIKEKGNFYLKEYNSVIFKLIVCNLSLNKK